MPDGKVNQFQRLCPHGEGGEIADLVAMCGASDGAQLTLWSCTCCGFRIEYDTEDHAARLTSLEFLVQHLLEDRERTRHARAWYPPAAG